MLNRYTSIPPRAQPRKVNVGDENQSIITRKTSVVPIKTTRQPLSNITNLTLAVPQQRKNEPEEETRGSKRSASALEQVLPAGRDTIQTRSQTRSKRRRSSTGVMDVEESRTPQEDWIDIDAEDHGDPQMVSEYVEEIYEYCKEMEIEYKINPRCFAKQEDINEKMRGVLVDWLVEVHRTFKLVSETLFLTINILDRYLQINISVPRDKLQLVGVTCMLIASKYQEIYAPEVNDFVYISDNAYQKEQILECEEEIIAALDFRLTTPSLLDFLRRYSKAAQSDPIVHTLGKYIIEASMIDLKLYRYLPSQIAASAVYIARAMTHQNPVWTPTLTHYTGYTEGEARSVALVVNSLLKKLSRSGYKAIKKKYSSPKFGEVALLPLVNDL